MNGMDLYKQWTVICSRFLSQITSGRWLITLAAIYCLIRLTDTLCKLIESGKITLEAATYVAIIMAVLNTVGIIVTFYFNKIRPTDNGNGDSNGDSNGDTTTTTTTTLLTK